MGSKTCLILLADFIVEIVEDGLDPPIIFFLTEGPCLCYSWSTILVVCIEASRRDWHVDLVVECCDVWFRPVNIRGGVTIVIGFDIWKGNLLELDCWLAKEWRGVCEI